MRANGERFYGKNPGKFHGMTEVAVRENWERCGEEWHRVWPEAPKNYVFMGGELRKAMGLVSDGDRREVWERRLRGENLMEIANAMGIPIRVVYHVARLADGTTQDTNGKKPGERLDRLETRLIGELERRTQTVQDRRKLSMDEIAMGLKAVRDHRAVDIARTASGEGKGTSVAVHVASDWMSEEKGPTGEVQ